MLHCEINSNFREKFITEYAMQKLRFNNIINKINIGSSIKQSLELRTGGS
jgi:hypothetical protein